MSSLLDKLNNISGVFALFVAVGGLIVLIPTKADLENNSCKLQGIIQLNSSKRTLNEHRINVLFKKYDVLALSMVEKDKLTDRDITKREEALIEIKNIQTQMTILEADIKKDSAKIHAWTTMDCKTS